MDSEKPVLVHTKVHTFRQSNMQCEMVLGVRVQATLLEKRWITLCGLQDISMRTRSRCGVVLEVMGEKLKVLRS